MRTFLSLLAILALAACAPRTATPSSPLPFPEEVSSLSSVPGEEPETGNVTYRGVVEPLGVSIYMQGTHRLALADGRYVLLESVAVDLNTLIGEEVEVFGAVRPTVEAGGKIMRVEEAVKLSPATPSSLSSSPSLPPSSSSSLFLFPSSSPPTALPLPIRSSSFPIGGNTSTVSEAAASSLPLSFADKDGLVQAMAKEKFTTDQWTQEYCGKSVQFCIPIHRNWWFRSFGATASSLLHIEVGGSPVENLGDGVILVNLVAGDIASTGARDREVRMHGNFAVGYRAWSDGRHFEISAPIELKEAVQYMTENLR